MLLANGNKLSDVYSGIGQALGEKETVTINVPPSGRPFWVYLPGAKWRLTGATVATPSKAGWLRLKAAPGAKVTATHAAE
jgi:hypothetical protein